MIWLNSFNEINIQSFSQLMGQQLHDLQNCSMNVIILSITFDFLKAIKVHDGIFSFPINENIGDNDDDSSK